MELLLGIALVLMVIGATSDKNVNKAKPKGLSLPPAKRPDVHEVEVLNTVGEASHSGSPFVVDSTSPYDVNTRTEKIERNIAEQIRALADVLRESEDAKTRSETILRMAHLYANLVGAYAQSNKENEARAAEIFREHTLWRFKEMHESRTWLWIGTVEDDLNRATRDAWRDADELLYMLREHRHRELEMVLAPLQVMMVTAISLESHNPRLAQQIVAALLPPTRSR
jgi:hypothetical protein